MLEYHSHSLCGHGIAHVVVLVIEVVVSLEPDRALAVEQVFQVEVSNEVAIATIEGIVAITEVSVENKTIIKQLARECQVDLHIAKVALVTTQVRRNLPVVANLSQYARELR